MYITLEWIKKIQSKGFNQVLSPAININSLAARSGPNLYHEAVHYFHHLTKDVINVFDDYGYVKNLKIDRTPAPANDFLSYGL